MCSQLGLHCKSHSALAACCVPQQHNENAYKLALSQLQDKLTCVCVCARVALRNILQFMHGRLHIYIYTLLCVWVCLRRVHIIYDLYFASKKRLWQSSLHCNCNEIVCEAREHSLPPIYCFTRWVKRWKRKSQQHSNSIYIYARLLYFLI